MSASLMIIAGYLDLPAAHKLALMKLCDSADDQNRVGFPGLDAVRVWSGVKRSQSFAILVDLQEWGLVVQLTSGHRGSRATFKVFPDPEDAARSLAAKRGADCPGAKWFSGVPPMPTAEQMASGGVPVPGQNGSDQPDFTPPDKSGQPDPMDPERVQSEDGKGPVGRSNGSGGPDPFVTNLRVEPSTPSSSAAADAAADPPTVRDDVERICTHLADRIEGNGSKRPTIGQSWRDAARLLLDRDGRTEEQVHRAIDWCQDDDFWRCNIESMPTLRRQYDRLRLAAMRTPGSQRDRAPSVVTLENGLTVHPRTAEALDVAQRFVERHAAAATRAEHKEITR